MEKNLESATVELLIEMFAFLQTHAGPQSKQSESLIATKLVGWIDSQWQREVLQLLEQLGKLTEQGTKWEPERRDEINSTRKRLTELKDLIQSKIIFANIIGDTGWRDLHMEISQVRMLDSSTILKDFLCSRDCHSLGGNACANTYVFG